MAPLCREVANAHRARSPSDLAHAEYEEPSATAECFARAVAETFDEWIDEALCWPWLLECSEQAGAPTVEYVSAAMIMEKKLPGRHWKFEGYVLEPKAVQPRTVQHYMVVEFIMLDRTGPVCVTLWGDVAKQAMRDIGELADGTRLLLLVSGFRRRRVRKMFGWGTSSRRCLRSYL